MKKYNLLFIILLALFLRFYNISNNPPSLTWDEAAWGYNAYSLGVSGRDEFGKLLPLEYLESFGDFKPPMYAYLDVIPIKLFGLNEFAVRFPSAFLGTLTVLVTYFLTNRIFSKKFFNSFLNIGHFASFLLAISPWHINLSRGAFEANVASFFLVMGVWLFLESLSKYKWYLILSITSFVASIYTFNSARIVGPLLVGILAITNWKRLLHMKKELVLSIIVGILLMFPILGFLMSPQAALRFKEVNIFSDQNVVVLSNKEVENDKNVWWSKFLHNRRVIYTLEFLHHYFDNLNPNFLFIKGDGNPKFSSQVVGQMYIWELVFIIGGLFVMVKRKEGYWWIIPLWLLVGIIPAATARETPHALRIEVTLPTFQIITAYGLFEFLLYCKKIQTKRKFSFLLTVLSIVVCANSFYYVFDYYTHYAREYSSEWQYGYKDSVRYVDSIKNNFDRVIITEKLGRPYIYYLFYSQTDPVFFQETLQVRREVMGFVTVERYGKYTFIRDAKDIQEKQKRILYIDKPDSVPEGASVVREFKLLNGETVLKAYTL